MLRQKTQRSSVHSAILRQYGSWESPRYSYVREALARKPYADLVQHLSSLADRVREDTDPNDDVSFGYLLGRGPEQLFLQLSMVGPFATLQRLGAAGFQELVVPENVRSDFEAALVRHVEKAGVVLLDKAQLAATVPLRLVNSERDQATVYQALFSDTAAAPWS